MKKALQFTAALVLLFFASCNEKAEEPNPEIEAKLEKIVSLWEKALERDKALQEEDRRVNESEMPIGLSEARLALAIERHDLSGIVAQRKQIVEIRGREYETEVLLIELGKGDDLALAKSHAKLLEAQIGLIRAEKRLGK